MNPNAVFAAVVAFSAVRVPFSPSSRMVAKGPTASRNNAWCLARDLLSYTDSWDTLVLHPLI